MILLRLGRPFLAVWRLHFRKKSLEKLHQNFDDFSRPSDESDALVWRLPRGPFFILESRFLDSRLLESRFLDSRCQILDFLKARGRGSNTPLAEGPANFSNISKYISTHFLIFFIIISHHIFHIFFQKCPIIFLTKKIIF